MIGYPIQTSPNPLQKSSTLLRFFPQTLNRSKGRFFCVAMFTVYILYSVTLDRYYVGYSENFQNRIMQHNSGISGFTSKSDDWVLKYQEQFPTRETAMKREKEIKNKKSRKYIDWLISSKK